MDTFQTSVDGYVNYPVNLIETEDAALFLQRIRLELQNRATERFCPEAQAKVKVIELYYGDNDFEVKFRRNQDELQKALQAPSRNSTADPQCRFLHITAESSRSQLNITQAMMQLLCSYHQVLPEFLDCISVFGYKVYARDCVNTSFSSFNRLPNISKGTTIPELGRSGYFMQHCYGLTCVERSTVLEHWPWAVRHLSVYHSLDLRTAQCVWIVVKANELIQQVLHDGDGQPNFKHRFERDNVEGALTSAFEVQQRFSRWSADNWHWYLDFIEGLVQDSRPALLETMEEDQRRALLPHITQEPLTAVDEQGEPPITPLKRAKSSILTATRAIKAVRTFSFHSKRAPTIPLEKYEEISRRKFTFKDLPRAHFLEEKVHEAKDAMYNNIDILEKICADYTSVLDTAVPAASRSSTLQSSYDEFMRKMKETSCALRRHAVCAEKLLRLLGDRKSLLSDIVNYQAAEASRQLAEKANLSAVKMEKIAEKQKQDMVSVRIITIITLFFLPGTFISVCTMMSTSIVKYNDGDESIYDAIISSGAIKLFVAISVPLVALTIILWLAMYWWENRKDRLNEEAALARFDEKV